MNLRTIMASLFAIFMLSSCEDIFEDSSAPDGSRPDVKISSPTSNRSFTTSQGLPLKVTIVDKDKVKELNFAVSGTESAGPLLSFMKHPNLTVVELDTIIGQNQIQPGEYKLEITATDYRSNITKEEVNFKIK